MDKQTNKVLAKDSITINVTNNLVIDFGDMKVTVDGVLQENNQWIGLDKDAKAAGVIAFATDNPENKAFVLRFVTYDEETGMATLRQTAMKEITKSAKTWSIKLAVRYVDKAGNEKDSAVTYKIIIK